MSKEDLDLKNLSYEELEAVWNAWLFQAQSTNDTDSKLYSHGVFTHEPRGIEPWSGDVSSPNGNGSVSRPLPTKIDSASLL